MGQRFIKLVDTLYEAAFDDSELESFVKNLSDLTGSNAGGIHLKTKNNLNDKYLSSYASPVNKLQKFKDISNLHRELCFNANPPPIPGTISYSQEILQSEALPSNGVDISLLKEEKVHTNLLIIDHSDKGAITACFMHEENNGEFSPEQKAIFSSIMPDLQRVFRLRRRIKGLESNSDQISDLLDMLPYSVILFNSDYQVMYINESARSLTSCNDGLSLHDSNLCASQEQESKRLKCLLKKTIDSTLDSSIPMVGSDMLVTRPSNKRAYSLMINPISPKTFSEEDSPAAIVIIQDIEKLSEAPVERLKELYSLTPTESLVAHQMALGHSLERCAEELGHTIATSRNLLKRVFAKTGTVRQNELVSLLLRSPLHLKRR